MASKKTFPLVSAAVAFAGWVLMLAGTAYVYHTVMSSELEIDQVLNPGILHNPTFTPTTNRRGYGNYRYTTTTSELDESESRGLMLMSYAWYYNDTDILVEGYMWWVVAFQLFGIIYSVATDRKLAALSMHVVLTASTFMYTRTVLSGYLFCLVQTVREHRSNFKKDGYSETFDDVKAGLAVLFAGCIIVDVANVMIVHALAHVVETSLTANQHGPAQRPPQVFELSPHAVV
jgi:hypothetical protein